MLPPFVVCAYVTLEHLIIHNSDDIVVGCFVIGMLLTPPDIISQSLLAIPMWLLFETGVLVGKLVEKPEDSEQPS